MIVEVIQEPIAALKEYGDVPNAFEVKLVLDVSEKCPGEFLLTERSLDVPYLKDYDAIHGHHPFLWATRFDGSNWGLFAARMEDRRVGGAVVAFNTPGLSRSGDRRSAAVLWDIRVSLQCSSTRRSVRAVSSR